jgi:hypothetical protein
MAKGGGDTKIAFVLIDGLALSQWLALKTGLKNSLPNATIEESALFAWIPTITPISRQAAFSGKIPLYFEESILQTDRDEVHWRQFWVDKGFHSSEIAFCKVHGNPEDEGLVEDVCQEETRVLGLTIFKVDKIMHGMQLGSGGMLNQVQTWVGQGFPSTLLKLLLKKGFTVVISADHGNTETYGIGSPKQGVLCEIRGERCRIFSQKAFADACLQAFPGTDAWTHAALPSHLRYILAPDGKSFTQTGLPMVCHGGAALEEVAVPFALIKP